MLGIITSIRNRFSRGVATASPRVRALFAVALAGATLSACDVHGLSDPGTLASITVTPNATIATSSTQQMIAVGRDADGRVVTISPAWTVAAGGGTVNSSGLFTSGTLTGLFTNTVVATVGSISGRASITVTPGPLATITLLPSPVTLAVTTTQQFVAVGKDASGNIVQLNPSWTVVASGGTISQTGLFTAGGTPGTFTNTVQVSDNGIKAFATVNVTVGPLVSLSVTPNPATLIVGDKQQFLAVGKDVSGNVVPTVSTWSVVALGGTIDGAGLFTAGAALGTYTNTVKATSGTLTATATVIVTSGPLANIIITPNPATMTINGQQQFMATGADIAGNPVVIVPVWSVVASGGTIGLDGLFTAGTVSGTFTNTIRATSGTLSGFATVIVTSGPLATITVTPNPVFMPTNSTQQFLAVGRDASNNVFVISPVWSVINNGGVISNTGLFTAGGVGGSFPNTIQATAGLISGTASVTVTTVAPPPPPSLLGRAAPFGILAGQAITCAVSGTISGTASNIGSFPLGTVSGFVGGAPAGPCTFTGTIPLPAIVSGAQDDLTAAYIALQGQICPGVPLPSHNLTGFDLGFYDGSAPAKILPPGTYCFNTSAALTGTLKLTGAATDVWTFQIGSTLTATVGSSMILAGVLPNNVYWAVGSSATLKTASDFSGNIVALQSITLEGGATLHGRALARNGAVDMTVGGATIIRP